MHVDECFLRVTPRGMPMPCRSLEPRQGTDLTPEQIINKLVIHVCEPLATVLPKKKRPTGQSFTVPAIKRKLTDVRALYQESGPGRVGGVVTRTVPTYRIKIMRVLFYDLCPYRCEVEMDDRPHIHISSMIYNIALRNKL